MRPPTPLVLALTLLGAAFLPPIAPGLAPREDDLPLELARRLLGARGVELEGSGLALTELAGILDEGLEPEEIGRVLAAPELPAVLPLAPELEARLEGLLVEPYRDEELMAWLDDLGSEVAGLAAFLHLENEAYSAYRIRLGGDFAACTLRPGRPLVVQLDPGPTREGEVLVARAVARFREEATLEVERRGRLEELADQHLVPSVDLGLGLELVRDPSPSLRTRYLRLLRGRGVWVYGEGKVLERTPRPWPAGYVERHVLELPRRFRTLRRELGRQVVSLVGPGGEDRRTRAAAMLGEAGQALGRLEGYARLWRGNLELLEGMARGESEEEIARQLRMSAAEVRRRLALLEDRVGARSLPRFREVTRSGLDAVLKDLLLRSEALRVRLRQVLAPE